MSAEAEVVLEQSGPVLVARLNRPEARNSLTPGMLDAIGSAILAAETDSAIRVLVLTGTGDRAFCVGMDLRSFAEGADFTSGDPKAKEAFQRLMHGEVTVPIVGAANGTAVGGGFELLLGCDVVVASAAAKFGLPEVKRGLIAAGGGAIALGSRLPLALAMELSLTGDYLSAPRAYELGLVNAVAEPDQVLSSALALAERIAANGPLAVTVTKELVRTAAVDTAGAWTRMKELQPGVFASEDAKEGTKAFIEKRAPQWTGR